MAALAPFVPTPRPRPSIRNPFYPSYEMTLVQISKAKHALKRQRLALRQLRADKETADPHSWKLSFYHGASKQLTTIRTLEELHSFLN